MSERSKCCNAKVKVVMSGDFFGDTPKTQRIGTCHYVCLKCKEACDVIYIKRRTWNRNPAEQIIPDKRRRIRKKDIEKDIEENS
jgi:hypothetical protein